MTDRIETRLRFRFWQHRDFALLWAGQLGSLLGTGLFTFALFIDSYNLTHSAFLATAVFAAGSAPGALLGVFAGVVADRRDRRRLMIGVDIARAVVLLPLLAVHDRHQIWLLLVVMACTGALGSLFMPAYSALLPATVPREVLGQANAFFTATRAVVAIAAPAAGAAILAATGLRPLVVVDAVSFVGSVLTLSLMTTSTSVAEAQWRHQLRNGLSFVAGHRIAFVVVLTSALFGLASGMFGALIVPFLRQSLHTSTRVTGIVFALAGAGGLLGGVLAAPLLARIGARRLTILSDVAAVGTFAVLVSAGGITEALPAMAGVGVTNSLYSTGMNTLLQTAVPADYLGRTFGVYSAAASAASLLSAAVPLLLLPAIGIRPTLLAALGVATVAGTVSLVGLSSSQSRRLAGESAA